MSPDHWIIVDRKHLFRRTAVKRRNELQRLQEMEAKEQLESLGIGDGMLRVGPRRWHGFWRVEQLA